MGGARAVNMDRKIGSLTVGKEADIIFINTDSIQMIPMNGAINAIVEYATPADVDTVMVAGNIVKQHGKLVGVDMTALKRKAEKFREDYFKKCNVPYDGLGCPSPISPILRFDTRRRFVGRPVSIGVRDVICRKSVHRNPKILAETALIFGKRNGKIRYHQETCGETCCKKRARKREHGK